MTNNRILTMGSFDMFHVGHASLLQFCSKLKGKHGTFHVGVNSDDFMTEYKRKPIIPFEERSDIIFSYPFVDLVFPVRQHDMSKYIEDQRYTMLVIGEDWAHKDYHAQIGTTKEHLKSIGCTLIYKEIDWPRTTTQTMEEVRDRADT